MIFLVDHNLEGHALLVSGNIASLGWLDLLPIRFITFEDVGLSVTSDDRIVWRFAQANQMILLTANRSMKGKNSLEQVMREENTSISFANRKQRSHGLEIYPRYVLNQRTPNENNGLYLATPDLNLTAEQIFNAGI